jgi:tRNA(Ile)-lysidine synthase
LLYHLAVREQVLQYIRERKLLKPGDRVAVAVSGGADSVALLRVLLELQTELGIVLVVAHFNHELRGEESDGDEHFVADLARQHDLPFFAGRADVRLHSIAKNLSLEHAARDLRYRWLCSLAVEQQLDAVATGHTLDDQAETVLMKFLRGSGTRGLAAIRPTMMLDHLPVVRPLLEISRHEIEQYLRSIDQPWREDHTNRDIKLTRNRIRHELLPILERDYNPNIRHVLSETAEIALSEEDYWRDHTSKLASRWHQKERRLRLHDHEGAAGFLSAGIAVQRRALKHFLEWHGITVDFHHVEAARMSALGDGSMASLPGGWQARRQGDWLELLAPTSAFEKPATTQPWLHLLHVPGRCDIPEAGISIEAVVISADFASLEPPGSLLNAADIGPELIIRNWQPGDRFHPAHSAAEDKLKRLFSRKRIPAAQRPQWPVALSGSQIVWVHKFPAAHGRAWVQGAGPAVRIDVVLPK